jgi:hypothetical protein
MFPRWIIALFAVEAAGIAAVIVVGLHLLGDGASAAGSAISWAQPRLHLAGPLPSLSLPLPMGTPTPAAATPRSPFDTITTGNGLLDTLNGSTKTVTLGQIRILTELENAVKGYVEVQLRAATGAGR